MLSRAGMLWSKKDAKTDTDTQQNDIEKEEDTHEEEDTELEPFGAAAFGDTATEEEESEDDPSGGTWVDTAEQFSSAVLASIPRTNTAKLAAAFAVLSYLVYINTRLEQCAAAAAR